MSIAAHATVGQAFGGSGFVAVDSNSGMSLNEGWSERFSGSKDLLE
jgi:hypothetical protein